MSGDEWYWDLERKRAVPAAERGVASNMLGPYTSRAEAENWQRTVDERNDAWDDADDDWESGGDDSVDDD